MWLDLFHSIDGCISALACLVVVEGSMNKDEWTSTSQPGICEIPLREYGADERSSMYNDLQSRTDWGSTPMPSEYLMEIVDAPKGTPCRDYHGYVARIHFTIKDEYLSKKDWDCPGSSWEGLHSGWIAWTLTWRAIDEALEMAISDEGIDWATFDRKMMATLNSYLADLQSLPDLDGEPYEDRGEY
jgi:hypothetical protein